MSIGKIGMQGQYVPSEIDKLVGNYSKWRRTLAAEDNLWIDSPWLFVQSACMWLSSVSVTVRNMCQLTRHHHRIGSLTMEDLVGQYVLKSFWEINQARCVMAPFLNGKTERYAWWGEDGSFPSALVTGPLDFPIFLPYSTKVYPQSVAFSPSHFLFQC